LVSFLRWAAVMSIASNLPSTRSEILAGRLLAICLHPYAAWQSGSRRRCAFLLMAYLAASYALVLGSLQLSGF
jgi:hypothetical protein